MLSASLSRSLGVKSNLTYVRLTLITVCSLSFGFLAMNPAGAEETGTLKMTFRYKGGPVKAKTITPTVDKAFCGLKVIPEERLIVNSENQGLKNVVVWVYTGRRGTKLPDMKLEPKTHTLANEDCRFEPHVLIAKKGDTLKVTNPDKVGHNVNIQGFNNEKNLTVPAGGEVDVLLEEDEPSVIPVACNIHPWMQAQVLITDHPFAAVSNDDGVLIIKGLPVGEEIVFRANHETGSFKEVIVGGKKESWKSSKFEVEIKAGMNDMGIIEIPADAFK